MYILHAYAFSSNYGYHLLRFSLKRLEGFRKKTRKSSPISCFCSFFFSTVVLDGTCKSCFFNFLLLVLQVPVSNIRLITRSAVCFHVESCSSPTKNIMYRESPTDKVA